MAKSLLDQIKEAKNKVVKFLQSQPVKAVKKEVKKVNPITAATGPNQTLAKLGTSKPVKDLIYKKVVEPVGQAFTANPKFSSSPVGQLLQGNVKGTIKATQNLPAYYNQLEADKKRLRNHPDPKVRELARKKEVEDTVGVALNTLGGPTGTIKTKINKELEPAAQYLKGKLASNDVYLIDEFLTWVRQHGGGKSNKSMGMIDPRTLGDVRAMSNEVFGRKAMDTWSNKKLADSWDYVLKRLTDTKRPQMGLSVGDVGENFAKGNQSMLPEQGLPPQSIQGRTPNQLPGQVGSSFGDNIPPEQDPVKKIIQAIKGAKPIRGEQEVLYRKARAEKFARMANVGKGQGEQGFFQQLGQLKGELPKADFESVRPTVTQADVDTLFDRVRTSPYIDEWSKINAQTGLAKLLGGEGATVPTKNELRLLHEVFGKEFTDTVMSKRGFWKKAADTGGDILNIPRSLQSSVDLSAVLRQGVFEVPKQTLTHPIRTAKTVGNMLKAFASEGSFRNIQENIRNRPSYKAMKQSGLALTDVDVSVNPAEEAFMSKLAGKIPLVRNSERAYVGFLNKLRADTFDDFVKQGEKLGIDDPKFLQDAASFVNNATGRGELPGKVERAAPLLNAVFFSPRLMASRLNLINPAYYAKLDPNVRKEAVKSLLAFGGMAATALGLAKAGGADVSADPRNADFGKIKVGNTRYDILGGFQQYIRLAAQIISGKVISSTTGKEITLGEGYKPMTRKDVAQRFFENKLSPVASAVTDFMRGTSGIGEKLDYTNPNPLKNPIAQKFLPILFEDLYSAYKEEGLMGVAKTAPGILGVGTQTYGGTPVSLPEAKQSGSVGMYKYLKTLKPDEANKALAGESDSSFNKFKKFKAIEEMGLGEPEWRMVGSGISNGDRAEMIANQLNKLPTKEQKNEYINKLYDLGIMDEDDVIYNQLGELKKKGKLKAPSKSSPVEAVPPEPVEEMSTPKSIINAETAPITQSYGNYNPEVEIFSGGTNYGTDFGVGEDTELSLPQGVWEVVEANDSDDMNRGYGKSILVENRKTGERIRLSHLNQVLADQGELLRGGSTIGFSGSTGNSTGPHVDVEYYDKDGNIGDILKSQYAKDL